MKTKERLERDAEFIKDIDLALEKLQAIKYVHTRDNFISDDYVVEKLSTAKLVIDNSLKYWNGEFDGQIR